MESAALVEVENQPDGAALALATVGVVTALSLSVIGAAFGTFRSASGAIAAYSPKHGEYSEDTEALLTPGRDGQLAGVSGMRGHLYALIPTVMSGVVAIYGLIASVILAAQMSSERFGLADGCRGLAAGLTCGICCLAAGIAQGQIGRKGAASLYAGRNVTPIVMQLIYAEALGLYGLVMALLLLNANKTR